MGGNNGRNQQGQDDERSAYDPQDQGQQERSAYDPQQDQAQQQETGGQQRSAYSPQDEEGNSAFEDDDEGEQSLM